MYIHWAHIRCVVTGVINQLFKAYQSSEVSKPENFCLFTLTSKFLHSCLIILQGGNIICDRILENGSKSHIKSSVFQHVFNYISTYA